MNYTRDESIHIFLYKIEQRTNEILKTILPSIFLRVKLPIIKNWNDDYCRWDEMNTKQAKILIFMDNKFGPNCDWHEETKTKIK
jgi:hypothetical protein